MNQPLRTTVIKGTAWIALEKIGTTLLQMTVGLVLAWFLMPEDFALIGILLAIAVICNVLVDSGFSAALIRKKEVDDADLSAVFLFNVLASVVLYIILLVLTPVIANYYDMPQLRQIAPVMFLLLPAHSISIIQVTMFTRKLEFKTLTKYTLWANVISSVIAVLLAFAGAGVWTLVVQRLTTVLARGILLWVANEWRPSSFSLSPLKSMWGYSIGLLGSDLVNSIYSNISQLFIGKMYTPDQLGYYEQARKWKEMPVSSITTTIQGVTFPALSKLQDDKSKMSLTSHQVVMVMNFLIYPVMIGLIAVAYDFFAVLLPERWLPTVPIFQVLCISGLFAPLSVVSYNILKTKGRGRTIFRLEIIKKVIATAILALTLPVNVQAIVWGQVAIFFSDAVINSVGAGRLIPWGLRDRLKEVLPYLAFSLVMWAVIHFLGIFMEEIVASYWILLIKIIVGAGVYLLLSWIFKPEAWHEVRSIFAKAFTGRNR